MPELPEVETIARDLRAAGLPGRRIVEAIVAWPRAVAGGSPAAFVAGLRDRRIVAVSRRAKYLLLALDRGGHLVIHLRMTGQFRLVPAAAPRDPHEHVWLVLDDGRELRFHDTRKFGRWRLTGDLAEALPPLGPEPLDPRFTAAAFAARLRAHRRQLKPLLLDQAFLAGVGNIYADESLWAARLHPQQRADRVAPARARALHAALREVLRRGIRNAGTSLGHGAPNFQRLNGRGGRNAGGLRVFRRAGQPCPRCGAPIRRLVVAQRGTHVCPRCQPPPRRPLSACHSRLILHN